MKTKQRIYIGISALVAVLALGVSSVINVSAADGNKGCGVDTSLIDCSNVSGSTDAIEGSGLWSLLLTAINILTAGIGIAAVGGIVYGAVLYTSAGGKPEQVKKATTVLTNVVIGILAYAAMFSLLNYLIPGGVFSQPTPESTPPPAPTPTTSIVRSIA